MRIGITGGIASGKSTVSSYLRKKGWQVIDADHIARQVVEPDTQGLRAIVDHFTTDVLTGEGTLNRQKLGSLIFNDPSKRKQLNEILHPLIEEEMLKQMKAQEVIQEIQFVDIPLLFEMNYDAWFDETWVVYVSFEEQLQRLMKRNELTLSEARARIASQMPLEDKRERATRVLDNSKNKQFLYKQVDQLLERMLGG